jgi:hypothetical protein
MKILEIWSYAHKIKHIFFCIFKMNKVFRNFWNFSEKQVFLISNRYLTVKSPDIK